MKKTHYRQHRKSTHLAGVDIEVLEHKGSNCVFTIQKAYFKEKENVNGRPTDAYIIEFAELKKPWVVNSVNRNQITRLAVSIGMTRADARWIENWEGMKIQLYFESNVSFGGSQTGGIRVRPILPKTPEKPIFTAENMDKALKRKASIDLIKKYYQISVELEAEYLARLHGFNKLNKEEE